MWSRRLRTKRRIQKNKQRRKKGTETGFMERKAVVVLKREEIKRPLGMTTTVPMEVRDRGRGKQLVLLIQAKGKDDKIFWVKALVDTGVQANLINRG